MAVDASKLRRGLRRLGEPPTDSNPELTAPPPSPPATPPAAPVPVAAQEPAYEPPIPAASPAPAPVPPAAVPAVPVPGPGGYIDGRSRRRTGRIEQINVKVSSQFNRDLRGLADQENLLIVEVLERALSSYLRLRGIAEGSGRTVDQVLNGLSR